MAHQFAPFPNHYHPKAQAKPFPSPNDVSSSISAGLKGPDCHGEEREVILIWSHVSGKQVRWIESRCIQVRGEGGTQKLHVCRGFLLLCVDDSGECDCAE